MLIARSAWETPTTGAQAGVLEVLAEHADLLLDRLPKGPDLVERTRKAIGQRLRGSDSSLEGVAAELAMTPRTLQRHLRELGYSYNALADEVRQGLARLYLQQPDIAIAEVAYLLGFADQSAFNRAFKRWNGLTPKQFRSGRGDTAKTARSDAIDDRRVGTSAHMPARRFPTPTSPGRFVDRSDSGRTMAWHIQPAGEERMGSLVDTLKTQHAAVQKMATEISQLVERTDIGAISAKLTSLKTALLGHLDLEDKKLYPALIKAAQKKDPAAAETARMFATNMVGISRVLIEFLGKYEGKKFSADAFAQDWQGILGALAARINSEEATLYPLYEKWTK
jgi:AraC-like DNA-binding protein